MSIAADFNPTFEDHLRHMLGAGSHYRKSQWGFRNHFLAEVGTKHHDDMLEMVKLGLVEAGGFINRDQDQYFRATLLGCQKIELHKAAIKRAFER